MNMGTPTSPMSLGHQSQYLPSFLLGDSMSHVVSPMSSRLWSGSGGSPPRSGHKQIQLCSPSSSGFHLSMNNNSRSDTNIRGRDKGGAPPVKSLLQTTSSSRLGTPSNAVSTTQFLSRTAELSTPAPPTIGLSHSMHDCVYTTSEHSGLNIAHSVSSPAQLDPFYTQGESLSSVDVLDDTWITVFGFHPAEASYVLQQFSQCGNILKHVITTEGNWMHIHYQSKIQAKKGLSKNGKILGNNIMVGVTHCIDKKVMGNKDNEFDSPSMSKIGTSMRPLTVAYMTARNDNEVIQNSQAPKKNSGFINKAMEYMFGW